MDGEGWDSGIFWWREAGIHIIRCNPSYKRISKIRDSQSQQASQQKRFQHIGPLRFLRPRCCDSEKLKDVVGHFFSRPIKLTHCAMDTESSLCHHASVVKSPAEDWMSLSTHLAELSEKHKLLERRIQETMSCPNKDELEIRRLKHEKLKLKDRISELKS